MRPKLFFLSTSASASSPNPPLTGEGGEERAGRGLFPPFRLPRIGAGGPLLLLALASPTHAQTPPMAAPAVLTAPAPDAPYILSPDDQLDISVQGHDEFKSSVTILPDGTFNYPVIGKVHAAGQTVDGLTQRLTKGLSAQLNQPQVTVTLKQGRARKVSVLGGAAKSPGLYDCRTGMHLLDLIALSGGPAVSPALTAATLVTDNGRTSTPIDLPKLLSGADAAQNLPLSPGDVLFLTPRDASVAQVQVVGEVTKPGSYDAPTESGVSLLSLINLAGGATVKAALTQAQVMHAGQVTTYNLRPLLTSDLRSPAGRVRLVPGDVLLIPANTAQVLALGEVGTKGVLPIPDGQTLPLTVALALSGGITAEGDKKNVNIVRRGPDGKAVVQVVNADDLLKGKGDAPDPTLRPGDILYVPSRSHPQTLGTVLSSLGALSFLGTLGRL